MVQNQRVKKTISPQISIESTREPRRRLKSQEGSWKPKDLPRVFSEMLLFSNQLPSARFEAIMTNPDAKKESCSAQFGSFDYMFYYYFN
jgi:hypothetical protein